MGPESARRLLGAIALGAIVAGCGARRGSGAAPAPAAAAVTPAAPAAVAAPDTAAALAVEAPVSAVSPADDASPLDPYVRTHAGELRTCYEQAGLKVDPKLAGDVTLSLHLASDGHVRRAGVRGDWAGEGGRAVEACIAERARAWRFPAEHAAGGPHAFDFRFSR
ncbi:MAG TPA: AgmX/PglI C-terminal domain-containing protein [Gemmatimonadaceae bacterium]|nr:AgmX/PglI C-terminal domain-containing protein [Gemmatimonadaceae bacterium]